MTLINRMIEHLTISTYDLMRGSLVQVINFATVKTWQYPWKSVDISTSKCFLFRGNYFVAIETTPNLRRKRDDPFPSL